MGTPLSLSEVLKLAPYRFLLVMHTHDLPVSYLLVFYLILKVYTKHILYREKKEKGFR